MGKVGTWYGGCDGRWREGVYGERGRAVVGGQRKEKMRDKGRYRGEKDFDKIRQGREVQKFMQKDKGRRRAMAKR